VVDALPPEAPLDYQAANLIFFGYRGDVVFGFWRPAPDTEPMGNDRESSPKETRLGNHFIGRNFS